MATATLTKDNFTQTVSGDGIVLVDFWGAPMRTMLHKLGLHVLPAGAGDARTAVRAAGP